MFDDIIVVYKFFGDLMFFVTGSQSENELILYAVLQAFYESISLLLRCQPRCQIPSLAPWGGPVTGISRLIGSCHWL